MTHATEDISASLRRARESKGISQRELGRLTGVPQGHISKIESGAVDIRVSSLIALARALDLEVTLVPRKAVPAVQSIARQSEAERGHPRARDLAEIQRILKDIPKFPASPGLEAIQRAFEKLSVPPALAASSAPRPAYTLDDEDGDE